MWALINKYNYVVDCLVDMSLKEARVYIAEDRYLVEMTLDNSPAYMYGYYDGKKFYAPKENFENFISDDLDDAKNLSILYKKSNNKNK